jgi:hypothetical protein
LGNKEVVLLDLKYRLGLSMMSVYTYSALTPIKVSRWAKTAGLEFLQVLPHRGIDGYEKFALPALYVEDAWNPVWNLPQALRGEEGDKGMPSDWHDWAGFPNPKKCDQVYERLIAINHARPIAHNFKDAARGRLVELCPEIDKAPEEIDLICGRDGYQLVLDTEHIVRNWRGYDDPESPNYKRPNLLMPHANHLDETIRLLAPHVQVVHVKNIWRPLEQGMIRTLLAADHAPAIDFVMEYPPVIRKARFEIEEFASTLRYEISRYLNEQSGGTL